MLRQLIRFLLVFLACACAMSQSTPPAAAASDTPAQPKVSLAEMEKRPKLSDSTRLQLISSLNAEFARSRKTFPVGTKDITLTAEGQLKPEPGRPYQMAMTYGAAAKVGDRVQITNVVIHEKSVYLEINGGPKKKTKW